jgi:hypothetical protein
MITPDWIRVPIDIVQIVPMNIGSAKITKDGKTDILIMMPDEYWKKIQQDVRDGKIESLRITPIYNETNQE